jgi:transcriptional regulator with XRE-family HTH domain
MLTVIRKHRLAAKKTIREVSRETGIHESRLSRIEGRTERIWRGDIERLRMAIPSLPEEVADTDRLALLAE